MNVDNKNIDVTDRLIKFSEQTLPSLNRICGYIFIQGSPSCGLFKVKVYQKDNLPSEYSGRGIYAKAITNAMPLLPVEEAERLTDPILREHFIARVFIYHHWQMILQQGLNTAVILDVYASNKDRLMLHAPKTFIALGQLLKDVEKYEADEFKRKYIVVLLQALENHHKQ
ncbi:MAG: hypothetical protein COA71_05405 [SAR86 cluster bacterium]|uniref:Uncharacterized protein n=1 Tax=SAR86 cluster bacterium TaxID=2030880 RepID=A0A2A5CHF9_9GAMM|nr:MAG: hypothetical protein COA71_05405 [SAR86 cluster bacterium]